MGGFDKRDYYAFQELWRENAHNYIQSVTPEEQYFVINKFRDSLIDITPDGKRALRTRYENWERDEWGKLIENKIEGWKRETPFESSDKESVKDEREQLRIEYNYLRFKKILQIIQDSGIGLGTSSGKGYNVGPKDKSKFTGKS